MLGNKIKDNRKRWQYLFVKYIIKSPILYYGYLIFYKNIYQKLDDLFKRRISFTDEKINLYRAAIDKYTME